MSRLFYWSDSPDRCVLGDGEVHAWRASLDVAPSVAARLFETLADEERSRAKRFRNVADERRFTVARGLLRAILAAYIGLAPSAFRFSAGIHGKPELAPPTFPYAPRPDITFNVSHSGDLALYAIARGRHVGIDVERMDARVDIEALSRRFLSEAERSCLDSFEDERRTAAFYRAWTSKEAYLKARGVGFSLPLESFDVFAPTRRAPRLLTCREAGAALSQWTLMELPAGPDYAATLAIEGTPRTVRLWRWRETTRGRAARHDQRDDCDNGCIQASSRAAQNGPARVLVRDRAMEVATFLRP